MFPNVEESMCCLFLYPTAVEEVQNRVYPLYAEQGKAVSLNISLCFLVFT